MTLLTLKQFLQRKALQERIDFVPKSIINQCKMVSKTIPRNVTVLGIKYRADVNAYDLLL